MLKFIQIEKKKINMDSNQICKKIFLSEFMKDDYKNIDLNILNSKTSLILIYLFEKSIPKKFIYFERIIEELKFFQKEYSIDLFFSLKKIRKYFKNNNYIIKSHFNKLLISYLMNITENIPNEFDTCFKEFKTNIFNIEINLSNQSFFFVNDFKKSIINTDNIEINIKIVNKNLNSKKKNEENEENEGNFRNSLFFRKIDKIDTIVKFPKKKTKSIKNKIVLNILVDFSNPILNLYSKITTKNYDLKNITKIDFLGIPIIENRYYLIYSKYFENFDTIDYLNLGNFNLSSCINLLYKKNNSFYDNYLNFIKKYNPNIDYIKNLIDDCTVQQAKKYINAFKENKIYMKELFLENLKKKYTKKNASKIYRKLEDTFFFVKETLENSNIDKFINSLIFFKKKDPVNFFLILLNELDNEKLYYRKWVYFRYLLKLDINLNIGFSPWKIENNNLISFFKYDDFENNIINYKKYGFWNDKKFIKNMYLEIFVNEDNENRVNFRGLIASFKKYEFNNSIYSWIVIGYDNHKFIDLIIKGTHSFDIMDCLEGNGIILNQNNFEWIIPNEFKNSFLV